jgi:thioredoxin reductase (NADPH)
MAEPTQKLIIIGGGPAAWTAALYAGRAEIDPLVLTGGSPGGQLMLTTEVENFPGFVEGINGPVLMSQMQAQAEKFGAVVKSEIVEKVWRENDLLWVKNRKK